uniref:Alternative protein n=1 Tax=Steinernema glaseri TaxID=37863 RepID=A0A1I8ABK5_9BILA
MQMSGTMCMHLLGLPGRDARPAGKLTELSTSIGKGKSSIRLLVFLYTTFLCRMIMVLFISWNPKKSVKELHLPHLPVKREV